MSVVLIVYDFLCLFDRELLEEFFDLRFKSGARLRRASVIAVKGLFLVGLCDGMFL